MIIYNVTINIDKNIHNEWLEWMLQKHIPDVMKTGCFENSRILRVQDEEETGITYAVQYFAVSKDKLDIYNQLYAVKLQHEHTNKFQGHFAAFRTILSIIQEFKK
jgi:hypothetical protein